MLVKTAAGNDHIVTISEREIQRLSEFLIFSVLLLYSSFSTFVSAVKAKTFGEVIQHASFEASLWTEMIPKVMLEYPDMVRIRPALNWGLQYRTMVVMAPGSKNKLLREHLEVVYPGAVYDGWGQRLEKPLHVVVPELMGNLQCRIQTSEDSGFLGLLERFLPPYTSDIPEIRDQQLYALCAFIGIHNYRFLVEYLGGCPGLTLISTEPGVSLLSMLISFYLLMCFC